MVCSALSQVRGAVGSHANGHAISLLRHGELLLRQLLKMRSRRAIPDNRVFATHHTRQMPEVAFAVELARLD